MKMKNGMYLFAAAIVASTVGLSSCSNDEEAVGGAPEVAASKVTMGVYASGMPSKRLAAGDVNLNGTVQNITDVTVVPVFNGTWQTPINLGSITAGAKQSNAQSVNLLKTVNEFLVYGNVPNVAQGMKFIAADAGITDGAASMDYKKPYGLTYYADITNFKTSTESVENNDAFWNISSWNDATQVGDAKAIKLSGVKYAMGVLAAGVRTTSTFVENQFSKADGQTELSSENWAAEINAQMTLTGIVIEGQPAEMDAEFNQTGSVKVFEAPADAVLKEDKIKFTDATDSDPMKVVDANFYTVVAPENEANIVVSFRFQNNTGRTLTLQTGETVADKGFVYYSVKLAKDYNGNTERQIFEAAYTTLLNANITDWSKGTITPPEKTDVFIGVEFETEWSKGLAYDLDI
jgi:hypothetical protein